MTEQHILLVAVLCVAVAGVSGWIGLLVGAFIRHGNGTTPQQHTTEDLIREIEADVIEFRRSQRDAQTIRTADDFNRGA